MKKVFAIAIIMVFALHFAGWYAYFGARLMAIHHQMREQLRQLPNEKLQLIQLTPAELKNALRESDEMEWEDKMYDIARMEVKDNICQVYALHDEAEDSLLGFLDEVLRRSNSDKKPVPPQLIAFIQTICEPVAWEFKNAIEQRPLINSAYLNLYSSIAGVIDTPPPKKLIF